MDPKFSSDVDTDEVTYTEEERAKIRRLFLEFGLLLLGQEIPETSATAEASETEREEEDEEGEGEDEDEEGEDEDEDEEGEDEDVDKDSCESDQEWDVDSFEGVEFHSEDEEDEVWGRYLRQCYKSEGFDVDPDYLPTKKDRIYCGFYPLRLDAYFSPPNISGREYMENMLKVVIDKYNESKEKTLVLDHIVRTVVILGGGVKAYIKFMAKESPEGELVEYQGKAEWKVWQRNIHSLLCRPSSQQRKRG